jgi:hypothetical protein
VIIPMNQAQMDVLATEIWGAHYDRAAATLPQGTHAPLFTITGGRIVVNMLLGEVSTVIGGANATKLSSYPTGGSAVDLCTTTDINGLEVGGKVVLPGTASTALTTANAGAIIAQPIAVVVAVGAIHLDCAGSVTGSMKWSLWWHPLDDGAVVTVV